MIALVIGTLVEEGSEASTRRGSRLPTLPSFGVFVGNLDVVIGRGRHDGTKQTGAEMAYCLAAVIHVSKSSGSGNAGPFEVL